MTEGNDVRKGLRYTKDHEWVRIEGDTAVVGISDHAQHSLGEITFVELPVVGKKVTQLGELAAVESAKAAADVFAPVSGTVEQVNTILDNEPNKINSDPYGDGWICKLNGLDASEMKELLSDQQYREFLELSHK